MKPFPEGLKQLECETLTVCVAEYATEKDPVQRRLMREAVEWLAAECADCEAALVKKD